MLTCRLAATSALDKPPATSSRTSRSRQLSVPLTLLVTLVFASGVVSGWVAYLGRSPVRQDHVSGTSAWWQQVAVAAVAGVLLGCGRRRRRGGPGRRDDRLWLLAPLGVPAARRVARTVSGAVRGASMPGRALVALPPAALFLYAFWWAGLQVIGGLDPDSTVNAWGGPTYLGAIACHYLDLLLILAVCGWLLDRVLLPAAVTGL
jgi:hypothetical protein